MKVKYVKYGLADFYGDHIELNKNLKNKPLLRKAILEHENKHKIEFSAKDIMHEFNFNYLYFPKLMKFIILHPSTWFSFLPIQYRKKQIVYDINLTILYTISIILVVVLFSILKKIF